MNNVYKTLVFFSGLGSFLLCLSSYSHAATWSEVSYNLSQNATAINACLTTATNEGQKMAVEAVEALENANACLEPIFQSPLDDVEINFRFRNPSFRNEIAIEGDFSVDLESLLQSSSISSDLLNKFTINNTECDLSNLNHFSYENKPSSLESLKLEYAITIIDKVLKQNPSNESISLLRSSLDELTSNSQQLVRMASQLDAMAANAQQRLAQQAQQAQQLLGFEIPSQVSSSTSPLLSSYSASDSSPQINFICQFDSGSFSVTTENGITDVLLVQQGNSNRNGFGFSFSRGSSTISYNDQSLKIKTRRSNNRVETTYQGLSFTVAVDQNITLPENDFVVLEELQAQEAWGEAGRSAYQTAAEWMAKNNDLGSLTVLSNERKEMLRPEFGSLVDTVRIIYNANMIDEWSADGFTIPQPSDAQTFCNRIYIDDPYNENDAYRQLMLLAHELEHSRQCEKLGGISNFGYHYFEEYKKAGQSYENNLLERQVRSFRL